MRISSNASLVWKDDDLHHTAGGKPVAQIVPDTAYPAMWRVRLSDGTVSGMLNRTRARDAGRSIALAALNTPSRMAA
jgi:hypothetical protein